MYRAVGSGHRQLYQRKKKVIWLNTLPAAAPHDTKVKYPFS